jgi:hypothetical protein
MLIVAGLIFWERRDLVVDGIASGFLMSAISVSSYSTIMFVSPEWIGQTYHWDALSGVLAGGVPIEEYIFWFLAGVIFGPFYEYVFSDRTRRLARKG